MTLETDIASIAEWIDHVHVETAQSRVDAAHTQFRALPTNTVAGAGASGARLCVHEAAHAVAAHFGGLGVGRVSVRGHGGGCEYGGDESFEARLAAAVADLAGIVAELHYCGADESRRFQLSHSTDVAQARLRVDTLRVDGLSPRAVATLTGCKVLARWPAIMRVAACLEALGELGGAEVAALAQGAQQ